MWMHKESKWLVKGRRKVRCYLCGKKILKKDPFMFHENTGYYSHNFCIMEANTIDRNERRKAVKKIAVGAAVVGAMAAGAGKFIDISSQSKGSNSPAAQTILTSQGLILPALTSDPANPVAGQMWYRSDKGVTAHFDAIENRVIYSNRIVNGSAIVTSKGIVNGLSVLPNDGQDWGPDTTKGATAPGQYGGTYTNTSGLAESSSYALASGNLIVFVLAGTYNLSAGISLGDGVQLIGVGLNNGLIESTTIGTPVTIFNDNMSSGNLISLNGQNSTVKGITVVCTTTKSSGSEFYCNGNNAEILHCGIHGKNNAYDGVLIYNTTGGNYDDIQITNVINSAVHFTGKPINITMNKVIANITINPTTTDAIGILIDGLNGLLITNSVFNYFNYGAEFLLTDNDCAGFDAMNVYFDSDRSAGIYIPAPATSGNQMWANTFTQCWTSSGGGDGVAISDGAIIRSMQFIGHRSNVNNASGMSIDATDFGNTYIEIIGGEFNNNGTTSTAAGINIYSSSPNVKILGASCYNGSSSFAFPSTATQSYGIWINQTITSGLVDISECILTNNTVKNFSSVSGAPYVRIRNCRGTEADLIPTTPSVPTSATAQENTNPYAVDAYVYGGDVTEIQITKGGTAYTVFSVSTAIAMSGQAYKLNPGDSITVTYTTAPTWEWLSD